MQSKHKSIPANPLASSQDGLLTKDDIAKLLRLSRRGIEELVRRRVLPVYRISRRCVRFRLSDVLVALDRFKIKEIGRE